MRILAHTDFVVFYCCYSQCVHHRVKCENFDLQNLGENFSYLSPSFSFGWYHLLRTPDHPSFSHPSLISHISLPLLPPPLLRFCVLRFAMLLLWLLPSGWFV